MTSTLLSARPKTDENAEVMAATVLGDGKVITAAAASASSLKATLGPVKNVSSSTGSKSVRTFGKPIDGNRKRSLSGRKKLKHQLPSPFKILESSAGAVKQLDYYKGANKRVTEDDGRCPERPVKRRTPEKALPEPDSLPVRQLFPPSPSTSKSPLPKKEKDPSTTDIQTPVVSDLSKISAEQQTKWMTEPDGANDPDYFLLLINERMNAIQEAWTENDQLAGEIAHLKAEQAVLDPLFEKMIEIKELIGELPSDAEKEHPSSSLSSSSA